ncbi:uncharacterized protein EDB91DRAFT_1345806 [Suillus paluster]|uniref:uncharacterized protein n=1 Tax=Suillus paluster TaxID=48578 RepID=UPI001B8717E7|nr:uncharacterized protein EDB91DRAFT_1345806 [Suillus paluster]KAG1744912.1 hypothetical protein EDB91DRAFT_1345806 [Suillus paluster]
MSTSLAMAHNVKRHLDESSVCVQINDKDDGEEFVCDEEPHMLSPEQGFGYYSIILGQQFGEGKLEIARKFGWAGHSSVWLARTLNAYPAMVDSLRTIKTVNPDHPGYQHLYDAVAERSHHGPHICIITNVPGANMISLRRLKPNGRGAFPFPIAKRIVKQTLLALDYLHRTLRVHNLFPNPIESFLRTYHNMDETDILPAAAFIRRCSTIDPRARPTALELLEDEWLTNA